MQLHWVNIGEKTYTANFGKYKRRQHCFARLCYREEWKNWGVNLLIEQVIPADSYRNVKKEVEIEFQLFLRDMGLK